MTAVHNDDRAGLSSVCSVNGSAVVLSLLNEALDRRRFRAHDSNYPRRRYHVAVAYIYQFHGLFDVLDLLAYLLDLSLHVDDYLRDVEVLSLRADSVDLAVHLLNDEVELSAYRVCGIEHIPEL